MNLTINCQPTDVLVVRDDETGRPTSYRIDLTGQSRLLPLAERCNLRLTQ